MKCRRCGEPAIPGNAYCQACSEAMARRAKEMESAAVERVARPQEPKGNLLRAVAWVTLIGTFLSVSPYLFFRAQEKVQHAGKEFNNLTSRRAVNAPSDPSDDSHTTLKLGKSQRTASLDDALKTGEGDPDDDNAAAGGATLAPKKAGDHFPRDISDWVIALQGFEQERQTLALSQIKTASDPGAGDRASQADQFSDQWIQLLHRYEKVEAPSACQDLSAAFNRTLRETATAVLNKIKGPAPLPATVSNGQETPVAVLVAPAQDADQLLHDICSKYHSNKEFSIEAQLHMPKQE